MKLRVSPEAEIEGLDVPEFGVLAYPDFVITSSHAGGHATAWTASAATSATDAGGSK
jgi:flavin reductase (DIM6/NTAB) family NADH-FMN oxidoreductase RutF